MKRLVAAATLLTLACGPALAAGGACSTAPKSQWQPQSKLESMLKGQGFSVRQIKVEKGCYEVYAVDKAGKRYNAAYNAETLQKLANAEAGES
jgi:hypothetical protein